MLGAGSDVFAVWGYVIANTVASQVEINPKLVAAVIGASVAEVEAAITYLCASDPHSRSKNDDGRRLVREGAFAYRVPNHETYKAVRNEEERREYNRDKKREQRERDAAPSGEMSRIESLTNTASSDESKMSAQAETEAETEAEERKSESLRLASLHSDLMKANLPNRKPPDLGKWAAEYERIIRIDKRDSRDVERVLRWSQGDSFWRSNILSPEKLRKQFDQLTLKMQSQSRGPNGREQQSRIHAGATGSGSAAVGNGAGAPNGSGRRTAAELGQRTSDDVLETRKRLMSSLPKPAE